MNLTNSTWKQCLGLLRGCLLIAAGMVATGCAPTSYVVLLDDLDGSTGKVSVTGAKGVTILQTAKTGAILDGSSKEPFAVTDDKIKTDFGTALAAAPKPPQTFILYFETGGAKLTPESEREIPKILEEIRKRPAADISIIGHTDTAGAAAANEALGLTRAKFVNEMIMANKLDVREVTVTSHGKSNLLVKTADNVSEPRNRRVEVTVR